MSPAQQREPTLEALARLQLDALRAPVVSPFDKNVAGGEYIDVVTDLAAEHGFEVLGIGSSRFAVGLDSGEAAKLAWDVRGLEFCLSEAAAWLAWPPRTRRHLITPQCISRELVLVAERAELLSPSLIARGDPEWKEATNAAAVEWLDRINALRAALNVPRKTVDGLRMDNYGLNPRGELVALDFDVYHPTGYAEALRWLYRATQDGPVRLDAAKRRLERHLAKRGGRNELANVEYDLLELAERAGWSVSYDELMAHHRAAEKTQGPRTPLRTKAAA